jgi:hypothetical protein
MMALFQAFALPGAKTRSKINKASILMSWVISFYRAAGCSLAKLHPLGSLPSIDRWERIVSLHAYLIFFLAMLKLTKEQIQKTSGPWWQPRVRRTLVEIISHTAQQR